MAGDLTSASRLEWTKRSPEASAAAQDTRALHVGQKSASDSSAEAQFAQKFAVRCSPYRDAHSRLPTTTIRAPEGVSLREHIKRAFARRSVLRDQSKPCTDAGGTRDL